MDLQLLGSIGDFVGGLGVIASLIYLALQIRQNTRAIRSSSYHQAAEQTWNYCLAIANDESLATLLAKRRAGGELTPVEQVRANFADQAVIYGFENMLRLYEEGLVDDDVWANFMLNSTAQAGDLFRQLLAARPGPLSRRLLVEIERFAPPVAPPVA